MKKTKPNQTNWNKTKTKQPTNQNNTKPNQTNKPSQNQTAASLAEV